MEIGMRFYVWKPLMSVTWYVARISVYVSSLHRPSLTFFCENDVTGLIEM